MLIAKLFAGMAGMAIIVAVLGRVHVLPLADLWLQVGRFSFGAFYWQLLVGIVCAVFAFAYFGAARQVKHPASQVFGLAGFFLISIASIIWLVSGFVTMDHRPIGLFLAAILSFSLGLMLSAANVAWSLVRD